MARLGRYEVLGQALHVIQRGNNRSATFAAVDDYAFYLDCLHEAAVATGNSVHAYVLMTNHVHLLVTPSRRGGVGEMMQRLGRRYVRAFNSLYQRTGTLWEGRYRATVVDGERYVLACCRYMDLNPVRAGMVARPADYAWSSHRVLAGGAASELVTPHPVYDALGGTGPQRQAAYAALFTVAMAEDELAAIRDATNKGWVLGGERFKQEIAALSGRRTDPARRGRPRKASKENGL